MAKSLLIIFQGAPGVGKSTLSKQVASRTGILLLGKDDIKEMLYDTLPQSDRQFSELQGFASILMLYAFAEALLSKGHDVIIDTALNAKFARQDVQDRVLAPTGANVLEMFCHTDETTHRERFESRAKTTRHPGHMDDSIAFNDIKLEQYAPLAIGDVVDIDTTSDDEVIFDKIISEIKKHQEGHA